MPTGARLCLRRLFSGSELLLFSKSILPEMSNSGSPPAQPGVYPNEIKHDGTEGGGERSNGVGAR